MKNLYATIENGNDIQIAVDAIIEHVRLHCYPGEESEYHIKLAFSELLYNSLKHSGVSKVYLIYNIKNNVLRSCVYDGGVGFNSKIHTLNLPATSGDGGRGVYIVNKICNSLRYNKKGDCAYFEISLSDRSISGR